jgi:hypothetical protein
MTPADWARFAASTGLGWTDLAATVGVSHTQERAYRLGLMPIPRKVALACSAVAMGLPEYGDVSALAARDNQHKGASQ